MKVNEKLRQDVAGSYGVLLESEAGWEEYPDWENLPACEQTKLLEICQQVREEDSEADLIDVIHSNFNRGAIPSA